MTAIWGSSSYWDREGRNLITEWTHLDGEIRARNGNKGMQCRRTYDLGVPTSFESSQAYPDYQKRVSALTISTDFTRMADGSLDNQLRAFVNDVPSDHTIYFGWEHEPEVKGPPATFKAGWARFAQVILNEGNTNIIPSLCMMGWTFNTNSGRDHNDWNPGTLLSGAERDACVAGVDSYAEDKPYTWTPNVIFDTPENVFRNTWGFDRVAIFETGVNQETFGRSDWMLKLEQHVNSRNVELITWWHSQVYKDAPENRWYIIFLDYALQAEPEKSMQTWADIIARNQNGDVPVVVVPPGDLPDPGDFGGGGSGGGGGGGGGTTPPIITVPGGVVNLSGEWSEELQLEDKNARTHNFDGTVHLMANDDGSATAAWIGRDYGSANVSISCARVIPGNPPVLTHSNFNATPSFSQFVSYGQSFRMGDNLFVVWNRTASTDHLVFYCALFDAEANLLRYEEIAFTTSGGSTTFIRKVDDTHLFLFNGGVYMYWFTVDESDFTVTTLGTDFGVALDVASLGGEYPILDATYSAEVEAGLAFTYLNNGSYYEIYTRPFTYNGSGFEPLGPWVGSGDSNLSNEWSGDGIDQADDGAGAVLSADSGGGTDGFFARMYQFDIGGNLVDAQDPGLEVTLEGGGAARFYHALGGNDSIIWVDQFSGTLHYLPNFFSTDAASDITAELDYAVDGDWSFYFQHDAATSTAGVVWFAYNMHDSGALSTSEYVAIRCLTGAVPNLAGAFEARRRRFARGPTANTG